MIIVIASSCQILGGITVNDAKMIHAALLVMRSNILFCALFLSCGNKVTRYAEQNVRQAISRNANTQYFCFARFFSDHFASAQTNSSSVPVSIPSVSSVTAGADPRYP